jgi:nitric oxide reductase subunit B
MTTETHRSDSRRWALLGGVLLFTFLVLGFFGREVYRQAPPIPERVVTTDGKTLMTKEGILTGQTVWQSAGGQQLGSIWGHGAYQAPERTADQLHREATALLDVKAEKEGAKGFTALSPDRQAVLRAALVREMRMNTFDAATGTVTITAERAEALRRVAAHFDALFGGAPELKTLRQDYAMAESTIPDASRPILKWIVFIGRLEAALSSGSVDEFAKLVGEHAEGGIKAPARRPPAIPAIEVVMALEE